jgi:hypothetical protein
LDRARQLCPGSSDVYFLRNFDGVIYLDTEEANGALDRGVSEKQLNGAEIAGLQRKISVALVR